MKTTIDIPDNLLRKAKVVAATEGLSLRDLVEEGLVKVLEARKEGRKRFRLRKATFRGQGLHPDVLPGSWERIRELVYEGRGS